MSWVERGPGRNCFAAVLVPFARCASRCFQSGVPSSSCALDKRAHNPESVFFPHARSVMLAGRCCSGLGPAGARAAAAGTVVQLGAGTKGLWAGWRRCCRVWSQSWSGGRQRLRRTRLRRGWCSGRRCHRRARRRRRRAPSVWSRSVMAVLATLGLAVGQALLRLTRGATPVQGCGLWWQAGRRYMTAGRSPREFY